MAAPDLESHQTSQTVASFPPPQHTCGIAIGNADQLRACHHVDQNIRYFRNILKDWGLTKTYLTNLDAKELYLAAKDLQVA